MKNGGKCCGRESISAENLAHLPSLDVWSSFEDLFRGAIPICVDCCSFMKQIKYNLFGGSSLDYPEHLVTLVGLDIQGGRDC